MSKEQKFESSVQGLIRRDLIEAAKAAIELLTTDEQELLFEELSQHCPKFSESPSDQTATGSPDTTSR
jgi:hypothetical protein